MSIDCKWLNLHELLNYQKQRIFSVFDNLKGKNYVGWKIHINNKNMDFTGLGKSTYYQEIYKK